MPYTMSPAEAAIAEQLALDIETSVVLPLPQVETWEEQIIRMRRVDCVAEIDEEAYVHYAEEHCGWRATGITLPNLKPAQTVIVDAEEVGVFWCDSVSFYGMLRSIWGFDDEVSESLWRLHSGQLI